VHVSQLADRFIKDAHEVVKAGDVVKVRVVEIDLKRKRISLTMRKQGDGGRPPQIEKPAHTPVAKTAERFTPTQGKAQSQSAFGAALAEALKRR
jgi:uncharacterized protein